MYSDNNFRLIFLELKNSNDAYSSKLQTDHYKEKDLISLAWKVKEISEWAENVTEILKRF